MRFQLQPADQAFQDEVRSFLADNLPAELSDKVKHNQGVGKAELAGWTQTLNAQGWAAPNWPKEHGGTGWSLIRRHIFDVECRAAHAPQLSAFGFNMVGPAIIKYGSAEQQAEYLPKILSADTWWCQGYSEPRAGSDLASVGTTAIQDGDEYLVNGQKIWTSGAELADWIFCLVRTNSDVQQQRGISFLLIDMRSPGVTVEPLYAFNGKRLWNQVFLTDVRVPMANRLGEQDRGWTVAKSLLGDERLLVSRVAENKRMLSIVRDALGSNFGMDETLQAKADQLELRLLALEMTSVRMLTEADAGGQIGAEPSMLKLKGSELVQAMDELLFEIIGHWVLPNDRKNQGLALVPGEELGPQAAEFVASGRYHHRGYTIAGGTSEVQHNIIAKQVLGL